MRFMQAYKRLDALCRDLNGIGVTGYIEDMGKAANGSLYVSGWNADFQRLKYYRHIRNQVAHEVDATEEETCSPEDAVYLYCDANCRNYNICHSIEHIPGSPSKVSEIQM